MPLPLGNEYAAVVLAFVLFMVPLFAPEAKYTPVEKLLMLQFFTVGLNPVE